MDEEQVAGEVKIFAGEFAGGEFQLDVVVCDDAGPNGLVRARLPIITGFIPAILTENVSIVGNGPSFW